MAGKLRLVCVLFLAGMTIVLLLPLQLIGLVAFPQMAESVPVLLHRILMGLFGIRLRINGTPAKVRPLMLVSNHVSWLDIVLLSTTMPVSFVAKAEMKSWPIFGQLAWLQRTIFVRREDRRRSSDQANEIAGRLSQDDAIVLFPEGTTNDGHALYPFKTTLLEAARFALVRSNQDHAVIQPVAIDYTHIHGLPIGRQWRQQVAWPGDVSLMEHFLSLIQKGALDVTIHFADPILFTAESDRKTVARQARYAIREMLTDAPLDSKR